MTTFIALLRGINVAGKTVKMEHLRNVLASMGFENARTYIQSGNVIFEAEEQDPELLVEQIAERLEEEFGFPIPVVIRTVGEWEEVIRKNPFTGEEPFVSFLSREPAAEAIEKVKSYQDKSDDEILILGREVYLLCKGSYHKAYYSNAFLEKKLGVSSTTRNWKTVNKLAALGKNGKG